MENKFNTVVFVVLLGFLLSVSANSVQATVGGPTLVYDLRYDSLTDSIYYTEQNYGGKGCPPELKAISIATGVSKVIYSCNDGLDSQDQEQKIYAFTSNFNALMPISLKRNNISISANVANVERLKDDSMVIRTNLAANVFQDKIKKATIPVSVCNSEQPLVVDGYRIPGRLDRLLLLVSRISDCWEGGYTGEFLSVISGVRLVDETPVQGYKTDSALAPREGSLVIYAINPKTEEPAVVPQQKPATIEGANGSYFNATMVLSAALILMVGIILGRLSKKSIQ
ncbi:MAG: hypothetical protein NT077_04380 [Candidatus Taylorbacteria bacterium]|nr:hypothetical protein [Candidatus Taylorbacteria bacterium]